MWSDIIRKLHVMKDSQGLKAFASHGPFMAALFLVVMSAACSRSSRMNTQFIFTEGYSSGASHCFLNLLHFFSS